MLKKLVSLENLAHMVFFILATSVVEAQELPIGDGAYLSKAQCDMAERGELDMVGFMVEKNGRSVGVDESGCIVANVRIVRTGRYHVEMDCQEFGELSQHQTFLDVIGDSHIRIDGEDLFLCKKGFLSYEKQDTPEETSETIIAALPERKGQPSFTPGGHLEGFFERDAAVSVKPSGDTKIASRNSIRQLIERWHEANEGCRGGHGDAPETDQWCVARSDIHVKLDKAGWCYGKDTDRGGFEYDWHPCEKASYRHRN